MLRRIALALALLALGPATAHAVEYDEWSPAGMPLVDRDVPTAVALPDGRALLAGGAAPNAEGEYVPGVGAELYDPGTNAWTAAAPMSTPRALASATVLRDGRVLVAGGTTKAGQWETATAELYDPATGAWSPAADMNEIRMGHYAVALADGRVLVMGGGRYEFDTAEIYDPRADRWTTTTSMPQRRGGAAVVRMRDGRVLVAGGFNDVELTSADVYDPGSERWTATGATNGIRYVSGAAVLPDGRVLVAGGWRWPIGLAWGAEYGTKTAELLDPVSLTWTPTGAMTVGRGEGATLLSTPTGTPVFIGGVWGTNNGGWLRNEGSVEAYDAATGTWSFIAPMASRRHGHHALTLADGTLLVFGGHPYPEGAERLVPRPPAPAVTPAPPVPTATPAAPAPAPAPVLGRLSFARPLPNRLKADRSGTLAVRLRCTGGACGDRLVLRDGRRRVLARRDVKAKAGATVTVKLKPTAAVRRKLRHRRTPATLSLTNQRLNRWVTLTG